MSTVVLFDSPFTSYDQILLVELCCSSLTFAVARGDFLTANFCIVLECASVLILVLYFTNLLFMFFAFNWAGRKYSRYLFAVAIRLLNLLLLVGSKWQSVVEVSVNDRLDTYQFCCLIGYCYLKLLRLSVLSQSTGYTGPVQAFVLNK